jgi:hypothetical protein
LLEEASRRNVKVFWLVDISGSMKDSRIQAVNRAIKEVLPDIKRLEVKENLKIYMAAIKFGSRPEWHGGDEPVELSQFTWKDLHAIENDLTSTAQAIEMLCGAIDIEKMALAFASTGRIAILSPTRSGDWDGPTLASTERILGEDVGDVKDFILCFPETIRLSDVYFSSDVPLGALVATMRTGEVIRIPLAVEDRAFSGPLFEHTTQ